MDRIKKSFIHGIIASCMIASMVLFGAAVMANGDTVVITDFTSDELRRGAPPGWELKKSKGTPDLAIKKTDQGYVLHLKSDRSTSYGIAKELKMPKGVYPFLNWKWKVVKLPAGGDVRKTDTDDQAIQIYIAFEATGWPARLNTPIIGYIWDNECPKGTMVTSSRPLADKVRYIVIRDKTDTLEEWYAEKRNVFDDYKMLFPDIDGGALRNIHGISVYINSQHTKSEAESCLADVFFSKD